MKTTLHQFFESIIGFNENTIVLNEFNYDTLRSLLEQERMHIIDAYANGRDSIEYREDNQEMAEQYYENRFL